MKKKPRKKKKPSSQRTLTNNIKKILDSTKQTAQDHLKDWIKPIACEIVFFVGLGFLMQGFGSKITEFLQVAGTQIIKQSQDVQAAQSIWELITNDPILKSLALKTFIVLILLLTAVYIWYSLVQGWLWAYLVSWKQKINKNEYMKNFFKINAFWAVVALAYIMAHFLFTLQSALARNIDKNPLQQEGQWVVVFTLIAGVFLVWSAASYVQIRNNPPLRSVKKSIKLLAGNGSQVLLMVGAMVALVWVVNELLTLVLAQSQVAGTVIGLLMVLPLFMIYRLLMITMVINLE